MEKAQETSHHSMACLLSKGKFYCEQNQLSFDDSWWPFIGPDHRSCELSPFSTPRDLFFPTLAIPHSTIYIREFLVNMIFSVLLYLLWCYIFIIMFWTPIYMFFIHSVGHGTFFSPSHSFIVSQSQFYSFKLQFYSLNPEVIKWIFKVVDKPLLPLKIDVILRSLLLPGEWPQMKTKRTRHCRHDKNDLRNNGFGYLLGFQHPFIE